MAEDDALPPTAVREILLRVPADQRARSACVCRAWRDVVADPALWTVLDLRAASGFGVRVTRELVLAAVARAQGRLEVLNVAPRMRDRLLFPALLAVATANATLCEVRTLAFDEYDWYEGDGMAGRDPVHGVNELQALLLAAPALQVLEASVTCPFAFARRLLRREPPFGPLRLSRLEVDCKFAGRDIVGLAADLAAHTHPSLVSFSLTCSQHLPLTPNELDSVVTAALALRLDTLGLYDCELTPEAVPVLCRLLSSTALTQLHIVQISVWGPCLVDEATVAVLAEALRVNRTLTHFSLKDVLDNRRDKAVLLLSLVGHASIYDLECTCEVTGEPVFDPEAVQDPVLIGLSIGALIAANSPALKALDVSSSHLGDAGLGPLCDALARNTHLRNLSIGFNGMSAAFAAQRLLPAVRANRSLRLLEADAVAEEAMQLVNARRG